MTAGSPKGRLRGLRPSKGPWLTTLRVHRRVLVYFRSSPINYSAGFRSDLITVLTISARSPSGIFFPFRRGTVTLS